jgi:hypothetical protein
MSSNGVAYRSFTCTRCCEKGLEWKPSKMMRKAIDALWLDDPPPAEQESEKDQWIEKLARQFHLIPALSTLNGDS